MIKYYNFLQISGKDVCVCVYACVHAYHIHFIISFRTPADDKEVKPSPEKKQKIEDVHSNTTEEGIAIIIESVDSISRDERDFP